MALIVTLSGPLAIEAHAISHPFSPLSFLSTLGKERIIVEYLEARLVQQPR